MQSEEEAREDKAALLRHLVVDYLFQAIKLLQSCAHPISLKTVAM